MEGIETIPGGSSLNSTRAVNFMIKDKFPNKCAFIGCIGEDERGKTLERELEQNGVHGYFHKDKETPTGTCAVIVHRKERTLCANLAACLKYPMEHFNQHRQLLDRTKILYTTSFFITSNYEALVEVATYAAKNNKPLGYNLSAPFLIQFHTEQVDNALQYADYVFGNEDEAKTYAEVHGIQYTHLREVAIAIAKSQKANTARPRVVIITQGKDPIICAQYQENTIDEVFEVEVPVVENVVDSNGAGDSFVGGFMASIALDKDIRTAITAGIWLSAQVIQRSGCTFPEKNEFDL